MKRTPLKRGTKPLKRTGSLKRSALRRITPKTAARRRRQAQGTAEAVKNSNGCCPECGKPFDYFNRPGRHHKVPRGLGGSDAPENQRLEGWTCCHEKEKGGLTAAAKFDQERKTKGY